MCHSPCLLLNGGSIILVNDISLVSAPSKADVGKSVEQKEAELGGL